MSTRLTGDIKSKIRRRILENSGIDTEIDKAQFSLSKAVFDWLKKEKFSSKFFDTYDSYMYKRSEVELTQVPSELYDIYPRSRLDMPDSLPVEHCHYRHEIEYGVLPANIKTLYIDFLKLRKKKEDIERDTNSVLNAFKTKPKLLKAVPEMVQIFVQINEPLESEGLPVPIEQINKVKELIANGKTEGKDLA